LTLEDALANEFRRGVEVIDSLETVTGASRFASGKGRHGDFDNI
jgi:enoyl-CoA hydratase